MSTEENKEIVRRYQDIYNSNNLQALGEVVAEDLAMPKVMAGLPPGLEGAKRVHETTLIGMPDWHTEINDLIAEADKVVARITMTGTHTGDLWGFPATGKMVMALTGYNFKCFLFTRSQVLIKESACFWLL